MIIILLFICLIELYYLTRYNKWLKRAHSLNDRYKAKITSLETELESTLSELNKYKQMYRESERVRKKLYKEIHNEY